MVTKIFKLILIAQLTLVVPSVAQTKHLNGYCENVEAAKIDKSKGEFLSDSLYASYSESAKGVVLRVVNTTNKPVYLFSSYFPEIFHSSKYIHRVNKKEKSYLISFLPLIPYLSTKPTDKMILGSDQLISKGQVLYNFIKMSPQTYYDIELQYDELFKNISQKDNLTCDFKAEAKSKFDEIKFKDLSVNKLAGKYSLFFDLAVYDKVDLLCEQSAYYLKEFEFDKQAKSFRTLRVPATIQNYNHPLF